MDLYIQVNALALMK